MRIVLLGPPGAGKGTQAQILSRRLELPSFSTGEVFEAEIGSGSELGRSVEDYVRRGALVPDELVLGMVGTRLRRRGPADGFLADGFPRTVGQAEAFDALLAELDHRPVDVVVDLDVADDVVLARIARRARTEDRVDDTPETARRRLTVFEEETAPVRRYYRDQKLLVSVDADGTVDEVAERIAAALGR